MARKTVTPFDLMQPTVLLSQMMVEANMVIAMRLWGMAGGWKMAQGEHLRMIEEKARAAQESGLAMARAVGAGQGPGEVAVAGMKPVRRRTKANVRRLSRAVTGARK
jgi:hypothetical protein